MTLMSPMPNLNWRGMISTVGRSVWIPKTTPSLSDRWLSLPAASLKLRVVIDTLPAFVRLSSGVKTVE